MSTATTTEQDELLAKVAETWYRADAWTDSVTEVPVIEVTDHTLLTLADKPYHYGKKEEKRVLRSENKLLFPTEEEAWGHIIAHRIQSLENAQKAVAESTAKLDKLATENPTHPAFEDPARFAA